MSSNLNAIDLTRRLIEFDTINPPGNEDACARYLGELLAAAGFAVTYYSMGTGRTNLVAKRGSGADAARPICFTGHLDTVPLGSAPWSVEPLGAEICGDKLYGRGSSDMKAGVASMVVAALANRDALDSGPGVIMVFTAGEETGCDGARHLSQCNGALGGAGAIVVGEPTSNTPRVGHKGVLWLNARTEGVTAHGSMPELGINAVYRAARLVGKLEDFGFNVAPHATLGSPTLNVGRLEGGININSVPDRADIGIDIRTIPGLDHKHLRENIHLYLGQELSELSELLNLPPVWTEPDNCWMRAALVIAAPKDGASALPAGAPYFTDASILKQAYGNAPTLVLGPGEANMAHKTDEYCLLPRIEEAVILYGALIRDWQANASIYDRR